MWVHLYLNMCMHMCHQMAYWVGMEPVVQTGPLLVDTHHLLHLLKTGI